MKHIILSILIIFTYSISAQESNKVDPIIAFGGIGGINMSTFAYSNSVLNSYETATLLNPQFGLCAEFYIGKIFSVRPSFIYSNRGIKIENSDINYLLSSENYDFSIPLILTFWQKSSVKPFIYIAPVYGAVKGGTIGLEEYSTEITSANHAKTSFGISPGLGLKFHISDNFYFSLEGAYHIGMSNTYSDTELSGEAIALNMNNYTVEGDRKNRATEVMLSLMFVINKKQDDEVVIVEEEVVIPDKNAEDVDDNDKPVEEEVIIEEKDNYTIEEIERYIDDGVDVTNRKISFDNIEFEFNKAELTGNSKVLLNDIVQFMNKNKALKVQINGHTDNVGSPSTNKKLSEERAKAVYNYLVSSGIESWRLSHKGFGDSQPIESNNTEAGRAKNRRVEFQILSQQ
jgi:outer membrane protein OmpA-like peptidoglycan-associated protein